MLSIRQVTWRIDQSPIIKVVIVNLIYIIYCSSHAARDLKDEKLSKNIDELTPRSVDSEPPSEVYSLKDE